MNEHKYTAPDAAPNVSAANPVLNERFARHSSTAC
jgi:hypothetical protein